MSLSPHESIRHILFTQRLKISHLIAKESPSVAFYKICIEQIDDQCRIVKESGVKGRVLDRRCWPAQDLDDARIQFQRRVKAKTNPENKSPRKYTLVQSH